jgi:hypothetical protein
MDTKVRRPVSPLQKKKYTFQVFYVYTMEFHNIYPSSHIIWVTKSRVIIEKHTPHIGVHNFIQQFSRKSQMETLPGKSMSRKKDLREKSSVRLYWTQAQRLHRSYNERNARENASSRIAFSSVGFRPFQSNI